MSDDEFGCFFLLIWMLGYPVAVVVSYAKDYSILWAIVRGMFSWAYVLWEAVHR